MYDTGVGGDLRASYLQQMEFFDRYLSPQLDMLRERARSTEIVDTAAERAEGFDEELAASTERMQSRHLGSTNAYQGIAGSMDGKSQAATGKAAIMDTAYQTQDADQRQANAALMGQYANLNDAANAGFTHANDMQNSRHNMYNAAMDQYRTDRNTGLGGLAGSLIGAYFGQPQIGGAIGSGIGSLF
ncbi:hypothetical protein ACPV5S_15690 [Vibrio astriarenae]|jgi:hypothetical protein